MHAVDWRVGPSNQYYNGIANQSVFIQGFKIAVRSSILGTKWVKVKAQPPVVRPQQGVSYYGFSRSNIGARLSSSWFGTSVANTSRETDADSEISIAEDSFDGDGTCDNDGNDITIQHIPEVQKVYPCYRPLVKSLRADQHFQPFHPSDIINQYLLQTVGIAYLEHWVALSLVNFCSILLLQSPLPTIVNGLDYFKRCDTQFQSFFGTD